MAQNPISTPLPADLPVNWTEGQTVAPNGPDVGLSQQHGYNYQSQQINSAQSAINTIGSAFSNLYGNTDIVPVVNGGTGGDTADEARTNLGAASNKNLLINWDFRNPVNTGGQQSYEGNNQYAIDMWRLSGSASMELQDSGIALTIPFASSGNWANCFTQVLEMDASQLVGRTVTVSILVSSASANVGCRIRLVGSSDVFIGHILLSSLQNGLNSVSGEIPENTKTIQFQIGNTSTTESGNVTVQAVKLEIGSVSTLQNDPPADKAEQENLCARFGSNGEFITGPLYSNPNLLDNWYFAGGGSQQGGGQFPINQRGATSYAAGSADYTIDRWRKNSTSVLSLTNGYLSLSDNWIYQRLEWAMTSEQIESNMVGKTYTLSVLTTDGLFSATKKIESSAPFIYDTAITNGSIRIQISDSGPFQAVIFANSGASINLIAAKLELGSVQTLARQDTGGNWVLHDYPPNFQQELAKCQRYQWVTPSRSMWIRAAKSASDAMYFEVATPTTFRANPAINTSLESADLNITGFGATSAATGFTFSAMSLGYGMRITATKEGHGLTDATLGLINVLFDANL
mgnify:CR=1 FL=1